MVSHPCHRWSTNDLATRRMSVHCYLHIILTKWRARAFTRRKIAQSTVTHKRISKQFHITKASCRRARRSSQRSRSSATKTNEWISKRSNTSTWAYSPRRARDSQACSGLHQPMPMCRSRRVLRPPNQRTSTVQPVAIAKCRGLCASGARSLWVNDGQHTRLSITIQTFLSI